MIDASLPTAVATVDVENSGPSCEGGGDEGLGVVSSRGAVCCSGEVGSLSGIAGSGSDIGSSSFFSLMESTILSRSAGVICLDLRQLSAESCLSSSGRIEDVEDPAARFSREDEGEEVGEEGLQDSSGIGAFSSLTLREANDHDRLLSRVRSGAQQSVSRFHNRQLRFSNLLPSSIVSAHLEKTVNVISTGCWDPRYCAWGTYPTRDRRDCSHRSYRWCASTAAPPLIRARSI